MRPSQDKVKKFMTPKKPKTDETLLMAFLVIIAFVIIFVFLLSVTHLQLDTISSNSKVFVTNKLEKFNKVKVRLYYIYDLSHQQNIIYLSI